MAYNQKEIEIIEYGAKNGKSREEVASAIAKYRMSKAAGVLQEAQPIQEQEGGVVATLKDIPSDIAEMGSDLKTTATETFGRQKEAFSDQQDGKQGFLRSFGQAFGLGAGGVAQGFGDVAKGAVKSVLSPSGEVAVKEGVEGVVNPVVSKVIQIPAVQEFIAGYENLPEDEKRDVDALFGVGSLAAELATFGAGGRAVQPIKRGVQTATRNTIDLASDGGQQFKNILGRGLESGGERIQQTVIKPSTRDIRDGFDIKNVNKYNLGGNLEQTLTKTNKKMSELSQELAKKLEGSDATADLQSVYQKTAEQLTEDLSKNFGDNQAVDRVLNNLIKEIQQVAPGGQVDLVTAQNIKRAAGTKGAWVFGMTDPDAAATERVYNAFYRQLKEEIERQAPEGIQEINKQLSELIPINNAVVRRIPIAERNSPLSLTDVLTLGSTLIDPKGALLFGINRGAKSGRVGDFLQRAGKVLQGKAD